MDVRIELRKGGLEAYAILNGTTLGVPEVARRVVDGLRQAGVATVPSEMFVQQAIQRSMPASDAQEVGVLVQRADPPKPGIDAQILPFFPIRDTPLEDEADPFSTYAQNVAYPGDVILKKTPPSEGIPGTTLLGAAIAAQRGRDISVVAGEGVVDEGGVQFVASTYGVILYQKGRLQVRSGIRISDDRMEARLTVLPDPRRSAEAQVEKLIAALKELGVKQGIDREALLVAVQQARTGGAAVKDVAAARGQAAVDGREADFRLVVDLEKKACTVTEGDRVDFREMESVKNVRKGEVLAERLPPVDPIPGFRVDGEILKPRMLRAQGVRPGEGTAVSEDGLKVLADADGMVVIQGEKFHVADSYRVAGDVDFTVGNIRASGAVHIRGQVKPGFLVQAGKEVEIAEDVWEAQVEASGDVKVRGGIAAGSRIKAGRNLTARYVNNSHVEVGGDMDVSLSLAGCEVYVKGKLRVAGSQGKIIGGEINAAMGIEAREIGAPSSRTRVAVGVDLRVTRELEALEKEKGAIAGELGMLQQNLGKEFLRDPKAALLALPAALRKTKLEVLQKMQGLLKRNSEIATRSEELRRLALDARDAQIVVLGEIHAGTQVTVFRARTTLTETLHHAILHYDPQNNAVVWRRI